MAMNPRGKLKDEDYNKIQKNYKYLTENLDFKDIAADCFENGLVDINEKQEFCSPCRQDWRTQKFLDFLLTTGGEKGYEVFIKCLTESDNHSIVLELQKTTSCLSKEDPYDWIDRVDPQVKNCVVKGHDPVNISLCLGQGWENLINNLGLTKIDIYREQECTRDPQLNICHLLQKWKQQKGSVATIEVLLDSIRKLKDNLMVDWDRLERYINTL